MYYLELVVPNPYFKRLRECVKYFRTYVWEFSIDWFFM